MVQPLFSHSILFGLGENGRIKNRITCPLESIHLIIKLKCVNSNLVMHSTLFSFQSPPPHVLSTINLILNKKSFYSFIMFDCEEKVEWKIKTVGLMQKILCHLWEQEEKRENVKLISHLSWSSYLFEHNCLFTKIHIISFHIFWYFSQTN